MKKIKVILILLVVLASLSFSNSSSVVKKEILFTADLVIDGSISKKKVEIFGKSRNNEILSLTVRGYLDLFFLRSFVDDEGTLLISERDKKLEISEEVDAVMTVKLDKNFSKKGGLVHVSVVTSNVEVQHNYVYVYSKDNKFTAYLNTVDPSEKIEDLDINILTNEKKQYEVEFYRIETISNTYFFPKEKK